MGALHVGIFKNIGILTWRSPSNRINKLQIIKHLHICKPFFMTQFNQLGNTLENLDLIFYDNDKDGLDTITWNGARNAEGILRYEISCQQALNRPLRPAMHRSTKAQPSTSPLGLSIPIP